MKWNSHLGMIAIIYSLLNILFVWHEFTLTGGSGLIYILIFPIYWIATAIIVGILTYRRRRLWFSKDYLISTICLLVFCTPLPTLAVVAMTGRELF